MERSLYADSTTIRLENIGCIIWSPIKHRYFLLSSKYQNDFINYLLEDSNIIEALNHLPDIKKDLNEIGVDESTQIVNNLNKSERPLYAPLEYYFDFTSKCNLQCVDCYNIDTWGNTCMDNQTIKRILCEMPKLGLRRVYMAGGEPITNIESVKIYLDTCYKLGITSSIATNGTLLTDDICEYLLSRNIFDISVSLDGWDYASSMRLRGREGFDDAVSGIRKLVRIKNRIKSDTEICIKPIIDRQLDWDFYEKMTRLAIELKVDKLKLINPERSTNHPLGYYGIDVDKYYQMNLIIANLQQKYRNHITITNGSNPCTGFGYIGVKGLNGCVGGQELLAINPDGRISPCLMDHTVLGNYYDYGSIESFLNNSKELELYQKNKDEIVCHSCKIYGRCRGGCQVRKIVQTGKRVGRDPLCPVLNGVNINPTIHEYSEVLSMIICAHSL